MLKSIILLFILVFLYYYTNTENFVDTEKIYFKNPYELNEYSEYENDNSISSPELNNLKELKVVDSTKVKPYKIRTNFPEDGNDPQYIKFNYNLRPEDKEFLKEQEHGVNLNTWYPNTYIEKLDCDGNPIWNSREKVTGQKDTFIQEHIRKTYKFNEPKSIHNDAPVVPEAAINTKISDVYDNYFVNYKLLTPEKTKIDVEEDMIITKGASNLTFYSNDTWCYKDEKLENGGMIKDGLYANDNNFDPVAIF
jgi:hypothetical protein